MKNFYLLLLLISTGAATAQITTPSPLFACDANNDGFTSFDLTSRNTEILNGENPASYNIRFYLSVTDAGSNVNEITNSAAFLNTTATNQVVFVRVDNLITSMMSIMTLELMVSQSPTATITGTGANCVGEVGSAVFTASLGVAPYLFSYSINGGPLQVVSGPASVGIIVPSDVPGTYTVTLHSVTDSSQQACTTPLNEIYSFVTAPPPPIMQPPTMTITENPYDGFATFDLSTQTPIIMDGQSNLQVAYFETQADALTNSNQISSTAYTNIVNPQKIWVNAQDISTGCFSITSFYLWVNSAADPFIFIPDPAFKNQLLASSLESVDGFIRDASGQPLVVDVNDDGEIQFSEALLIYSIDLPELSVNTMEGIQHFTNLTRLALIGNNLTTIDVSALVNLEYLSVNENAISELNVVGLSNLTELHCGDNQLTSLNMQGCPNLEMLQCDGNELTELDISGFPNLIDLTCYDNEIAVLDLSSVPLLKNLFCSNNNLTALNLGATPQLEILSCGSNQISSFDLTNLPELTLLWVDYNLMTDLDISALANLQNFSAAGVLLTSIDASANSNLCNYFGIYGPNLEYINLKNGADCSVNYALQENTNLQFVCADEGEVEFLTNYFTDNDMEVNVNSYCNFTPGGDYNTITGVVRFDANNNGCDATDPVFPFVRIGIESVDGSGSSFTDGDGSYVFYTQAGEYAIAPVFENQSYYDLFLPMAINFPTVNNSTVTQDYCIVANGVHPDVEVAVVPLVPSQPGFDALYKIVYKNKGNQLLSGSVFFEFESTHMTLVGSNPSPNDVLEGYIGFDYDNLMPFENREIIVTLNINAPTDTPPVNIGMLFDFTANVIIDQGTDETPADNQYTYTETVIGSYDPNDKLCTDGAVVGPDKIGDYLHYVINFENTGTAPAQNIVVRDVINPQQFDISSVQIMNASHAVVARQNGNTLECIFEGINLESGGHGNILLKIKTLSALEVGDEVANKADIFFDYNFPIETNDATTLFETLKVGEHEGALTLSFSPNPVTDLLYLKAVEHIETVQLYDLQGRLLQTSVVNSMQFALDVSNRQSGVYLVKVISAEGQSTLKFIKN